MCLQACSSTMHASQLPDNRLVGFFYIIEWKSHVPTQCYVMLCPCRYQKHYTTPAKILQGLITGTES